jgi:hypothetical protein
MDLFQPAQAQEAALWTKEHYPSGFQSADFWEYITWPFFDINGQNTELWLEASRPTGLYI